MSQQYSRTAKQIIESAIDEAFYDGSNCDPNEDYSTGGYDASQYSEDCLRQLYEAMMTILDTTIQPGTDRENLAREFNSFFGQFPTMEMTEHEA